MPYNQRGKAFAYIAVADVLGGRLVQELEVQMTPTPTINFY